MSWVCSRLLGRWLGPALSQFEVKIEDAETGIISPVLVAFVNGVLWGLARCWSWKEVKENCRLVPSPQ